MPRSADLEATHAIWRPVKVSLADAFFLEVLLMVPPEVPGERSRFQPALYLIAPLVFWNVTIRTVLPAMNPGVLSEQSVGCTEK